MSIWFRDIYLAFPTRPATTNNKAFARAVLKSKKTLWERCNAHLDNTWWMVSTLPCNMP